MMTTTDPGPGRTATPPGPAPAVALRGVSKTFGDVRAVRDLDLTVDPGTVVAFLGPNGAGKTTTIDMVLGLSEPGAGDVSVYGMAPREAIARGLVAAVMQTGGLLKDLTVAETVRLTASLFADTAPVDEVLERAGITAIAGRRVGKCSGGEQQRLRFAMALLPDPELLVLDEPTTGMDVEGRRSFWGAIRADAERGRTVVFATHYLEEADLYADRVVMVAHGRVVADGTASQVRAMVSGRTLRATLPGLDAGGPGGSSGAARLLEDLRALAGVGGVEQRGSSVTVHADDTDAVARHLLTTTDAHDLEIVARGLEDAFVALTADDETEPTTNALGARS